MSINNLGMPKVAMQIRTQTCAINSFIAQTLVRFKMNRCIVIALLSLFLYDMSVLSISSLDEETYNTFLELLKGEFYVPTKERSTKVKSALVRFWRNRNDLSLNGNNVCFKGKAI